MWWQSPVDSDLWYNLNMYERIFFDGIDIHGIYSIRFINGQSDVTFKFKTCAEFETAKDQIVAMLTS